MVDLATVTVLTNNLSGLRGGGTVGLTLLIKLNEHSLMPGRSSMCQSRFEMMSLTLQGSGHHQADLSEVSGIRFCNNVMKLQEPGIWVLSFNALHMQA